MKSNSSAPKILITISALSLLGIIFSNELSYKFSKNIDLYNRIQVYKSCSFIVLTAFSVYLLLKIQTKKFESEKTTLLIEKQILIQENEDLNRRLWTELHKEKELEHFASYDEMTGLYNRRKGLELFKQKLDIAKNRKSNMLVCFIDIDGLKAVNDSFGHFEGDSLINLVSKLLSENISPQDILCRLGGDEFLIIFPDSCKKDIDIIRRKIDYSISIHNKTNRNKYHISCSIGFAEYNYRENNAVEDLIRMADIKMYEQKSMRKMSFAGSKIVTDSVFHTRIS